MVGSKSGGIRDIIEHEKTGLLFHPDNADDLAEKILETLQNQEITHTRAKTACDRVKKFHTIDAMCRDIIRIYRLHQVKLERLPY